MNLKDKVVLVTGASSGIGLETSLLLGKRGASVALLARRKERVEATAERIVQSGGQALAVQTDVSTEAEVQAAVARVLERFGRIDVLINNAGSGLLATVEETTPAQLERLMRVNFMGNYYFIRSVLPVMRKQGEGQIIGIASMSGRRGAPLKGAYCASKFAQIGLMESLRMELTGTGIACTLVFPGATETEFFNATENPGGRKYEFFGGVQTAAEVAAIIVDSIGSTKPEILTQPSNRLQVIVQAVSPALADWLVRKRKKSAMETL